MPGLIFVLLLVVPIAELYVIVQISQELGVLPTIALLIGISVAGAWLLKREGMATWARLQQTLARGQMPTNEVTDGALILFGGALLLTPGFLSDVVGLVLLLPPTRAAVKIIARRAFRGWAARRTGVFGRANVRVYEADVVTKTTSDAGRGTTGPPATSPPERLPARDEDDSPDRG
ncbi:MAG: FxsA family protein [Actinomycetota bacterium]